MNGRRNYSQFSAISKVCFILAALVTTVFALSIQKETVCDNRGGNVRKFCNAFMFGIGK
jgi:hypothetical protein